MRERTKWEITCLVLIFMATMVGLKVGRWNGRAEMKRWQDSYYQSHPVVKEVPPKFTFDGAGIASECIVLGADRLYCNFTKGVGFTPATPKKAKPAKASKRQLTCKDIGGCAVVVPGQDLRINCAPNFDCNKRGDIDPQGAVCVAGSSDGHPIEAPCPQITWPTRKP